MCVDAVRDDLALMVSGEAISIKIREYAATSMNLSTREEIFSAMVVYGFLSFENGKVSIPNKELMDKISDMLQKKPTLGYVYNLAKESGRMLRATLDADTKTMAEILEQTHNTEVPLLIYNYETELTAIVNPSTILWSFSQMPPEPECIFFIFYLLDRLLRCMAYFQL